MNCPTQGVNTIVQNVMVVGGYSLEHVYIILKAHQVALSVSLLQSCTTALQWRVWWPPIARLLGTRFLLVHSNRARS